LPNGKPDTYKLDDTISRGFYRIKNQPTLPFCSTFDAVDSVFLPLNTYFNDRPNSWLNGTPNKANLNSSYSPPNSWYIGPTTENYKNADSSMLLTPLFSIKGGDCYKLSFYHQYDTEKEFDGSNVEYSIDGGDSWDQLGYVYDPFNWYNTIFVQGLWDFGSRNPIYGSGWTGQNLTGTKAEHFFNFPQDTTVLFRFKFGSDGSTVANGWVIDNFCFEKMASPCALVSVPTIEKSSIGKVYPNPTSGNLTIEFSLRNESKENRLEMIDLNGRILLVKQLTDYMSGINTITEDLSNLPEGLYLLKLITEDGISVERVLIQK
jgi:hypothetical protein